MKQIKTDFLVIGSGIAGLYTALKLSELGEVIIITKEKLEDSNTQYAQGGIAAVLDKGDSLQLHIEDTLQAGAGICEIKPVETLVSEGPERVKELIKLGTNFDHIEGELDLTREGAHSKRRILHARGDATGEEIRESLTRAIRNLSNIEVQEEHFMVDLIHDEINPGQIIGLTVRDNINNKDLDYYAQAVILASGGGGQVYANTSNPSVTTGDGIAVAYRAGADIMDMEFVQFHPTTLYQPEGPSFLISESVRGEGAVLRNAQGEQFMPYYHKLADLAPRDIVARAIISEIRKSNLPYVWLDTTNMRADYIRERFPTIHKTLYRQGLDMSKEFIPVLPAAHYMMGGIKTDIDGRTSLKRLYACGEVACTGVHGANRLASNSLLEGLVFGYRIYLTLKNQMRADINFSPQERIERQSRNNITIDLNYTNLRQELREQMMLKAGILRDKQGLEDLKMWLQEKLTVIGHVKQSSQEVLELKNMLTISSLISRSALLREESRGGHFRIDFPASKKDWVHRHIIFNQQYREGKIYALE